jgi:hypothetical protein
MLPTGASRTRPAGLLYAERRAAVSLLARPRAGWCRPPPDVAVRGRMGSDTRRARTSQGRAADYRPAAPVDATAPLRPFLVTAGVWAGIATLYALPPLPGNALVTAVTAFAPIVAAANWLRADARPRNIALVHDLGFFLFLAWPVVIPWYLVKTRGRHAWPMALVLLLVIATPVLTPALIALVRLLGAERR